MVFTGSYNVAAGYQSSRAITTGTENVTLGNQSGYSISTGNYNIAIGSNALATSTAGGSGGGTVAVGHSF